MLPHLTPITRCEFCLILPLVRSESLKGCSTKTVGVPYAPFRMQHDAFGKFLARSALAVDDFAGAVEGDAHHGHRFWIKRTGLDKGKDRNHPALPRYERPLL